MTLLKKLHNRLNRQEATALLQAVAMADRAALRLYVVGGTVRDLLLGYDNVDLDLVLEGDAIGFAEVLGSHLGARVVSHPKFKTATIIDSNLRLDITTARSETYTAPGALPLVTAADLAADLARRDFTINAMAIRLTGPQGGRLCDPCGGQKDLESGTVRILHSNSFRDDPTRMFRAVRYAARLHFRLEHITRRLLRRHVGGIGSVSGVRRRHELERMAQEQEPARAVRLARSLGLYQATSSAMRISDEQLRAIGAVATADLSARQEDVVMTILVGSELSDQMTVVIADLSLTNRQAAAARALQELMLHETVLDVSELPPSRVVAYLAGRPLAAIEALALMTERPLVRRRLRCYLDVWRFARSRLNGTDVQTLGVPPGPELGAVLAELKAARLDGKVLTREDEIGFVRATAKGGFRY